MNHTHFRAAGFTLLEMLVVLAILGVAMATAVGAMPRRGGGLDLADAAGRVADALRLARAQAIAQGRPVEFAIAADGRGWVVGGRAQGLPPSVTLARDGAIRFDPEGGATGGAIRLRGAAQSVLVRVDWLTGRVSVAQVN